MRRMMRASGVEAEAVTEVDGGLAFWEASTKCRYCNSEDECRAWLDTPKTSRSLPKFCPNARFFRSCRRTGR
jgi:hypothetical protein